MPDSSGGMSLVTTANRPDAIGKAAADKEICSNTTFPVGIAWPFPRMAYAPD